MENFENEYPPKEKVFIGREDCLNKIGELFATKQLVAISAFGGTGKSTLALEYCHRLIKKDSNATKIRWFNAASSFQLEYDFKELAELFEINTEKAELVRIIRAIFKKLEELKTDVLLVFDNVESYDDIKKFVEIVPRNVKILITTRDNLVNVKIDKIELEAFTLEEIIEFIQKNIDQDLKLNEDNISNIIELSKSTEENFYHFLPIKIELIVSYFNAYSGNKNVDELLNNIVNAKYLDQKIEARLLANLKLENGFAFKLLRICALLNPDFIEKKLLFNLYESLIYNELEEKEKFNKQEKFNVLFSLLNKLSLISNKTQNKINGIKMHRLIQDEVINYAKAEVEFDQNFAKTEIIVNKLLEFMNNKLGFCDKDPKTWTKMQEFYVQSKNLIKIVCSEKIEFNLAKPNLFETAAKLMHFEYISSKTSKDSLNNVKIIQRFLQNHDAYDDENIAKALNNIGLIFLHLRDPNQALEYGLKALSMRQRVFNSDHEDIASSLHNVASAYNELNNHSKALEYNLSALEMNKKLYATDHPDYLALSFNNVGGTYGRLKEHGKALEYHLKALEIHKRLHNSDHPDLATSLNNVGIAYDDLNQHQKALEFKLKGLEMSQNFFNCDHPDLATLLNNVAFTYAELFDHKKALEYRLKAYEMRRKLFDSDLDHPDFVQSLNSIGSSYEALNEHEKALEYQLRALQILKRLYHSDHPELATSFNNLGLTCGNLNDHTKALEYHLKALEIYQKLFGSNYDPRLATTLNNVGYSYGNLKNRAKELEYHKKALEMRESLFRTDHPDLAQSLNNIGLTYGELNDHKKALEYQLKGLEMEQRLFNSDHPDLAISLNNVGFTYGELNDHKQALEFKIKALEMQQRLLDSNHPHLAVSFNNVGFTYGQLNDYKKELEYYLKALKIRQNLYSKGHPDLVISLSYIACVYLKLNEPNESLEYFFKASEILDMLYPYDHAEKVVICSNISYIYGILKDTQNQEKFKLKASEIQRKVDYKKN